MARPAKSSSEWDSFLLRIYIRHPVEGVYHAWATASGLERWFLEKAAYFSPDGRAKPRNVPAVKGDEYRWKWWGHDYDGRGVIQQANGRQSLTFSFEEHAVVGVKIRINKGRTLVELRQEHRHPQMKDRKATWLGCHAPWAYHLTNLKSVLEGGLDLREKKPDVKELVNS